MATSSGDKMNRAIPARAYLAHQVRHIYVDSPKCLGCDYDGPRVDDVCPAPVILRAKKILNRGFYQVSRAYRTVARLPPGKSGKQVLLEAVNATVNIRPEYWLPHNAEWVARMTERDAKDQFLRVYASNRQLWLELDEPTFKAFRDLGGGTVR